ncbi:hypothetical protein [Erythrobacter sp. SG61-1L]|uniref:hypothetical protein n=1 Tax=Erythrobacter sp. SG61-1L TaxID=1603897 RepID=UPI000B1567D5|nr:hypothetical protein [Erythrobacter sp. SG61-1L]
MTAGSETPWPETVQREADAEPARPVLVIGLIAGAITLGLMAEYFLGKIWGGRRG